MPQKATPKHQFASPRPPWRPAGPWRQPSESPRRTARPPAAHGGRQAPGACKAQRSLSQNGQRREAEKE
eukprot:6999804-Pyramimonas_sp.AAC.1